MELSLVEIVILIVFFVGLGTILYGSIRLTKKFVIDKFRMKSINEKVLSTKESKE